jgi:hypothetical protein
MTSIEWLVNEIKSFGIDTKFINNGIEQAKEMHKLEIIDARDNMQKSCIELANKINPHLFEFNKKDAEQYYNETYGSKGSDEHHEDNLVEIVTSSQTEISDEEIDEMLFHHSNEYAIGFKDAIKWYREQLKQNL